MKTHVKKGDEVVVLAGKEKGKRGKIIAVNPKSERVIVEGQEKVVPNVPVKTVEWKFTALNAPQ